MKRTLEKCPCCNSSKLIRRSAPEPHYVCAGCSHRWKISAYKKKYYKKLIGRSNMLQKEFKKKNKERTSYFKKYLFKGMQLLELGCAEGGLGKLIKQKIDVTYCGIEPSKDLIVARKSINKVWADIDQIPSSIIFDAIFAFHVLEHIDKPKIIVSKLHKRLKPGGVLIAEVPNLSGNKLLPWDHNKEHTHLFSPASVACLLEEAGFNIIALTTGHYESAIYNDSIRVIVRKRKSSAEVKRNLIDHFHEYLGDRFVVYGVGGDFEALVAPYIKNSDVIAVIDSYKIGKRIIGKTVQGTEVIAQHRNERILIGTYRYQQEIIKLLHSKGINKSKIVTLEDILGGAVCKRSNCDERK